MACKIFLDTNVIADFLDRERMEHASALDLFNEIEQQNVHAFFSESVINTASYILRKIIPIPQFKILMNDMIAQIRILPCTNAIVEDAYKNAKNDLEDAVLYQVALSGKVDYFITSDTKDFKKLERASLSVVSAKKMIDILNS